jgi:hypothetical protein
MQPPAQNAVNSNFNNNISDNGLDIINMSTTASIYSQQSENSRNSVNLYAPELARVFDTTHTSTTDVIRTKPITEISIKTIQDKDAELPTTNSPPAPPFTDTTHADTTINSTDMLETTILAQTHTTSAFRHLATKNYAATDIKHKKTTQFSIPDPPFLNSKTAASDSCNPFHFLPIPETAHKLYPIIESNSYRTSSTACNTYRLIQASDTIQVPTPPRFDRHPSPITSTNENVSPLFSHSSSSDSAYNCLSTASGTTNYIKAIITGQYKWTNHHAMPTHMH